MMSLLCAKMRSFARDIFRPECLTSPEAEPEVDDNDPDGVDENEEQEQGHGSGNGSSEDCRDVVAVPRMSADQGVPLQCFGQPPHNHAVVRLQSSASIRSKSGADSATSGPPSCAKQVQNIYRKPMSRINSNSSLRRSRDPHFRCHQRLSRHYQLFDSDPSDIYYYYSPPDSGTQLIGSQPGGDRPPTQGTPTDEAAAQGPDYRRRVYTMPSVPCRPTGTRPHASSQIGAPIPQCPAPQKS